MSTAIANAQKTLAAVLASNPFKPIAPAQYSYDLPDPGTWYDLIRQHYGPPPCRQSYNDCAPSKRIKWKPNRVVSNPGGTPECIALLLYGSKPLTLLWNEEHHDFISQKPSSLDVHSYSYSVSVTDTFHLISLDQRYVEFAGSLVQQKSKIKGMRDIYYGTVLGYNKEGIIDFVRASYAGKLYWDYLVSQIQQAAFHKFKLTSPHSISKAQLKTCVKHVFNHWDNHND